MKNLLQIAIVFLTTSYLYCQNVLVEYENEQNGTSYKNELIMNDSISLWSYKTNDQVTIDNNLSDAFLLKDNLKNNVLQSEGIFNKSFYVKDSLSPMKWELTNEIKQILGEQCLSAKTNFRGRNYIAYYSNSLPFSNGPWKFGGLPGLILEVKSEDNLFQYNGIKIIKNYNKKIEANKFRMLEYINWSEFTKQFIITFDNYVKLIKTNGSIEDGATVNIKIVSPEIIYPKVQNGNGFKI